MPPETTKVPDLATQAISRGRIQELRMQIQSAHSAIDAIAKAVIPDFHFLNHRVSTFWECQASPIGMCLFLLDHYGRATVCRYCGGPEERK